MKKVGRGIGIIFLLFIWISPPSVHAGWLDDLKEATDAVQGMKDFIPKKSKEKQQKTTSESKEIQDRKSEKKKRQSYERYRIKPRELRHFAYIRLTGYDDSKAFRNSVGKYIGVKFHYNYRIRPPIPQVKALFNSLAPFAMGYDDGRVYYTKKAEVKKCCPELMPEIEFYESGIIAVGKEIQLERKQEQLARKRAKEEKAKRIETEKSETKRIEAERRRRAEEEKAKRIETEKSETKRIEAKRRRRAEEQERFKLQLDKHAKAKGCKGYAGEVADLIAGVKYNGLEARKYLNYSFSCGSSWVVQNVGDKYVIYTHKGYNVPRPRFALKRKAGVFYGTDSFMSDGTQLKLVGFQDFKSHIGGARFSLLVFEELN